ncbi:hypothetical protein ACET3Z_024854 [Daucus carota]
MSLNLNLHYPRHPQCWDYQSDNTIVAGKDSQGGEVIKPYTPTTLGLDVGHFKFVIKLYPQGRMSQHFHEMRVGDYMAVKGPKIGCSLSIEKCSLPNPDINVWQSRFKFTLIK